jgi:hypothetical protein
VTAIARGEAAELQGELRDLLSLAVVGDHVRWVLVDDDGDLAAWLAGWLDREQAERLLADRLHVVSSWARLRQAQAPDGETAQLLEAVAAGLELR